MDDDFSEFFTRLGTDVPVYRECLNCGDLYIVNADTYDKPKVECDPDLNDNCRYWLPCCACRNNRIMFTWEGLKECTYPECECGTRDE
jgi:hypothetical protein